MSSYDQQEVSGYVAVSLPDTGYWQGFYVMSSYADAGRKMIALTQTGLESTVVMPEIREDLAGGGIKSQNLVAAISAIVAELFTEGIRKPSLTLRESMAIMDGMGTAIWALTEVTGECWILVTARTDEVRKGLATSVTTFQADDLESACSAILAEVTQAKTARDIREEFTKMDSRR